MKSIIMAAGKGTRMKSDLPKVVHLAHGKPMIVRIIDALNALDVEENILILGHKREKVLEVLGNDVSYVVQEEQLGTGHAVKQAVPKIKDYDGDVLIINGDIPLIRKQTLIDFYNLYKNENADGIILSAIFENPFSYGRVIKDGNKVLRIVEEKETNEEQKKVKEINAGVYIFKAQALVKALEKINNNNEKGEYYITDVIEILSNDKKVISYSLEDSMEIQGVNSKVELALVSKVLRERKNTALMEDGVILIDPATTYIDDEVKIGRDTTIYPNVTLQGNTEIGENSEILSGTRIIDSKIYDNVRIESSVIEESIVENGVTIGPYAHLRPKSHLKENVHIGNFVETKKSTLEKGVKAGHLTYLGDAHIGEKTNIGAGTITCNYDGKNKFKTQIGKDVFI